MAKKKNDGLDAKWLQKLPEGWYESAQSMDEDELKKALVEAEASISNTERDRDADQKLKAVKDDAKLLGSAYKEIIEIDRAKIKAIMAVLSDQGKI